MSKDIYQEVDLTSNVLGASPKQLIQMLLDKCVNKIDEAKNYMQVNNVAEKGKAITRAIDILVYLQSCLRSNTEETKKMSEILEAVYVNTQNLLMQANATNKPELLAKARALISEVQSGWSEAKA